MNRLYEFKEVALYESCFKQKTGCPRQSQLVKEAKGRIILKLGNNSSHFIEGIEEYSHLWVLFVFHKNFHFGKENQKMELKKQFLKAKVTPPRLKKKVGAFTVRSPYRPNPIGQSIAKIEKIEITEKKGKHQERKCIIHVSGCDLVDQTPILDLKPYIPQYDSIPKAMVPSWVEESNFKSDLDVHFTKKAKKNLQDLIDGNNTEFYKDLKEAEGVIKGMIKLEPRSKYRQDNNSNEVFGFYLDTFNVRCIYLSPKLCHVIEIESIEDSKKFSREELRKRNIDDGKEYTKSINSNT